MLLGQSAVQPNMEELCARAGTNARKREALNCPPIEGAVGSPTVPNIAPPGETMPATGDPPMGETMPAETSPASDPLSRAQVKMEMGLEATLTPEEKAALDAAMAVDQQPAPAPTPEPGALQKLLGLIGLGG
jgi:hypothetical protein